MNHRPLPVYERLTGKLRFRDTLVHERKQKPAPLVETLLLRFHEAGWPEALESPLPEGVFDPRQQLIEAVRRLNRGLRRRLIRFHVRGSVITWEDRAVDQRECRAPRRQVATTKRLASAGRFMHGKKR
ncbi:MAG TPA: hypothetical protein VND64_05755 [Pirellulales bacterium]|nr:hypothetical protein [Pirellulales bacterium]